MSFVILPQFLKQQNGTRFKGANSKVLLIHVQKMFGEKSTPKSPNIFCTEYFQLQSECHIAKFVVRWRCATGNGAEQAAN
jgi:hypothetical protein